MANNVLCGKKTWHTEIAHYFRTRFNFVYFVLLAESAKFSSIRKPYTYTSVSDTTVAVRKFLAYESRQTLEYEIFTRMKISAITVHWTDQSSSLTRNNYAYFELSLANFIASVSVSVSPPSVCSGFRHVKLTGEGTEVSSIYIHVDVTDYVPSAKKGSRFFSIFRKVSN